MKKYTKIDQYIHQLSQTVAKFGRSFSEKKEDDSHTNLRFDLIGKQIWGRWANIRSGHLILSLNLAHQTFHLLDKQNREVASFETIGKAQSEVEIAIAHFLTKNLKVDGADFLKPLHFEIPDYDFKNDALQKWDSEALDQWLHYRALANQACSLLNDHLNVESEIRIWPHHFDTGIYTEVNQNIGIGFGWAMADSMIDEAYFYFSVYSLNEHNVDYATTKPLSVGKWITGEHWNGAVLPLSDTKLATIQPFLKEATQWSQS
ncbi:hypothetical protein U1E44_13530 [Arenibacter sp. GZD96]|uniref:hypothetical protein n=1 Tax=Aurantibrevibacter litoralis TaxID=3106030 RepID=UPI002AFF0EB5|nr:hypothetical protein [Arenibacter sp. GZD-96]MEA1787116.1 hypothetical protein [Arenibacter sp. GZD-96]